MSNKVATQSIVALVSTKNNPIVEQKNTHLCLKHRWVFNDETFVR